MFEVEIGSTLVEERGRIVISPGGQRFVVK